MRHRTKWLVLCGLGVSCVALVHCVGDEPSGGTGDDAGNSQTDGSVADNFVPPGDAGGADAAAVCAAAATANNVTCGPGVSPCIVQIAGGGRTFCARDTNCKIYCWGENAEGQLGKSPATTPFSSTPVAIDFGSQLAVGVDVGGTFDFRIGQAAVCARLSAIGGAAPTVACWGANQFGQLGVDDAGPEIDDGGDPISTTPVSVPGISNVAGLYVGAMHTCAVLSNAGGTAPASMQCWGNNNHGELGRDTPLANDPTPGSSTVTPGGLFGASVGYQDTCILNAAGHVECVGRDEAAELGDDAGDIGSDQQDASVYKTIATPVAAQLASLGNTNCIVTKTDSKIYCWGNNAEGEIGSGTATAAAVPVAETPPALAALVASGIQAGARHVCGNFGAVPLADGGTQAQIYCWGANNFGQSHIPTDGGNLPTPTLVDLPPGRIVRLAAGAQSTCALYEDGTVWCWGGNIAGELGRGGSGNDGTVQPPGKVTF